MAANDRFFHDSRDIFDADSAVPDRLRVDDNHRAEFTLVEATGGVGPNVWSETALFQLLLEGGFERLVAVGITGAAAGVFFSSIATNEDVMGEFRHPRIIRGECGSSENGAGRYRPLGFCCYCSVRIEASRPAAEQLAVGCSIGGRRGVR